jgi:drug/metabolite transporter (DMT)-like permease
MNIALALMYVIFAVVGSTLIKYGGLAKIAALFTIPFVNVSVSLITMLGIICYGVSFVLYILLLNKFDLSFISPVTVGLVYILLMITSVLIFNESFTLVKTLGCIFILGGLVLMLVNK